MAAARRVNGLYTALVAGADTEGPRPWLATAYVLLSADGPRLIDFGIAWDAQLTVLTAPGALFGSPHNQPHHNH